MKIIWLSANLFGYELLKTAIHCMRIHTLIILDKNSTTKMYDGIEEDKWKEVHNWTCNKINLIITKNINDEYETLKQINPDYIIMAGWRQIIDKRILNLPKYGFVGFHPSLLPIGRGPAPIINTILLGLPYSGSTMFFVDESVDSGDIIDQESFKIEEKDYAIDVYNKYIRASSQLIIHNIRSFKEHKLSREKQDESIASYFPKRTVKDNEIKITDSLDVIDKKIRAFNYPYLGAFIKKGNKKLIFERCRIEES